MSSVWATPVSPLMDWWRRLRNPAFWMPVADAFAVLTAVSLPWSTTLVAIFGTCWLGSAALIVDYPVLFRSLKQPICALPVAFFALAALGMMWSEAPWTAKLHALTPAVKFLFLPGLFHHFARSRRGMWVFAAFLASCALILVMSSITAFVPAFTLKPVDDRVCGVFVKNYVDQSQEFALCVLALAFPILTLWKQGKRELAGWLILLVVAFVANMVFVIASRTALVTMPLLLAVFAFRYLPWRSIVILGIVTVILGAAWAVTPRMCRTIETFARDIQLYQETNEPTSAGLRWEYWTKSLRFIADAPLIGHGTGSIRGLFEKAATGSATKASGHVIGNPHNQTLSVAIQWGIPGLIILYAMWLSHLLLFRGGGFVAWVGLLVVVQNILSSLFNSHLFDFHEGWMYVLGVGVAGGMLMRQRDGPPGEAAR